MITIYGRHFHDFGPYNQITLGTGDTAAPCVPRTLRNWECRMSDNLGSSSGWGHLCTERVSKLYSDEDTRRDAEYFDYSNSSMLECVVADTVQLAGAVDVRINPVEGLSILDIDAELGYAFDMMCDALLSPHCHGFGERDGAVANAYFPYSDEFATVLQSGYTFDSASTPTGAVITPAAVLPGALVDITGFGFVPPVQPAYAGWVLTRFGDWVEVNTLLEVWVGEFPCEIQSYNNTRITCEAPVNAAYNDPNAELYTCKPNPY